MLLLDAGSGFQMVVASCSYAKLNASEPEQELGIIFSNVCPEP